MNYTFNSMRVELLRRLGGRTDTSSSTRASEFLNSAQLKLAEAYIAIPAFEQTCLITLVEGQSELNLLEATPQFTFNSTYTQNPNISTNLAETRPYVNNLSDLIGIRIVQRQPPEDGSSTVGWRMPRMSWQEWREIEPTQATSIPIRWARNGYRFAVDPKPDREYQLKLDYRRRPQLDILEVEGEWQETMIQLATVFGWIAFGEPSQAQLLKSMLPANVRNLLDVPLDVADWDAQWDDELCVQPRMMR